MLIGTFGAWRWQTVVSVLGIVVAAAYMLKVIQQVLLGPLNERWRALRDVTAWELFSLVPLVAVVLALGVYPLIALQWQDVALRALIAHVAGR